MPQRGIHPLLNTLRVVMRNGASFQIKTAMRRVNPYMLQVDTTNNPIYTGESAGLSMEDERTQKVMSRYEGFMADTEGADAGTGVGAPPSKGSSSSGGGNKKKK